MILKGGGVGGVPRDVDQTGGGEKRREKEPKQKKIPLGSFDRCG